MNAETPVVEADDSAVDVEQDALQDELMTEIHALAIKRYNAAKDAWDPVHRAYIEDQQFAAGDQWNETVKTARTAANLSVLTYNQIPSKYKYIVNNARRAMPSIRCSPVAAGATKNTAKVLDGIVKSIQTRSNAKHAYIHALTCTVIGGIGAWRVDLIEDDSDGEGYDIAIRRMLNPTSVFMDPAATQQDFGDADYVFVESLLPKDDADARFGEEDVDFEKDASTKEWFQDGMVRVLEYWVRNKQTGYVEQYILNRNRILHADTNYRGRKLPIILVVGEEKHIDGKREYKGIVRDVKDMQTLLNLSKSMTADWIARASQAQYLYTPEMVEGFERIWDSPNLSGFSGLPYNGTAGKPERQDPPPPPVGTMQVSAEADADIRAAIGIRDPLEKLPANIATKTIEAQISQSNIGTLEYIDRLKDAVKMCGEIIVDLIPHYFGYEHVREIQGLDDQITTVQLNKPYEENGETVMHDLTAGRYAVTISDGPSYESQRSEASEMLMEAAQAYPQLMQIAGDIIFRNRDFEGSQEIADRLRSQLPPQVLAASSASNADSASQAQLAQAQVMQLQQQLQQLQAQNQQLHQIVQQAQQDQQTKTTEIQVKTQAELALEQVKHRNAMELEQLKLRGKSEIADKDNEAVMRRDILKGHTEVFKAELQHNAQHVTPLDDVPVDDPMPALELADQISREVSHSQLVNLFAPAPAPAPTPATITETP